MRRRAAALLLLSALSVAACTDSPAVDDVSQGEVTESPAPGSGWTVLLYSMADTDLEPSMLEDVAELGSVARSEDVALRALVDRSMTYSQDGVLDVPPWSGARTFDLGDGSATVVDEVDELNLGDPAVLQRFVADGMAAHPADNYALVISDHGASWPGVGPDDSSGGDVLTLEETRDAIAGALEEVGEDELDLLGFDACLMATYETASTLSGVAHRMLASQELVPGHGWDYRDFQLLVDQPGTTADELGSALIRGFQAQAEEAEQEASITLSLLDLDKVPVLDDAVTAFAEAMQERGPDVASVVGSSGARTLSFGRNANPVDSVDSLDLGQLVSTVGVEALQVSDEADAVLRAMGDVVVDRMNGPASEGASGLSVYFPPVVDHYEPEYEQVETAAAWAAFLNDYYATAAEVSAAQEPAFTDDAATATFEDDVLRLDAAFDPALRDTLVSAVIRYGVVGKDGTTTYFGDEPAELTEGGATGYYDLTRLVLSDGQDSAVAYYGLSTGTNGLDTIAVPLRYTAPDADDGAYSDVLLTLVQDAETGELQSEVYYAYDPEYDTYGELDAEPDGTVVPEALAFDGDGEPSWVTTSDVGVFADLPSITYDLERLPAGTTLVAELVITSLGGTTATAAAEVVVP